MQTDGNLGVCELIATCVYKQGLTGGLILFYNVMSSLGLVNTMWAVILPSILSVWNLFMTKTFFESSIPDGLVEAAKIDGAGEYGLFFTIVLPLSKAILAVMALYYAICQWNSSRGTV